MEMKAVYPHGDEGGGAHEPQNHARGVGAHPPHDVKRDPPVKVPPLHGLRQHEAAQEEKDDLVGVGSGGSGGRAMPRSGKSTSGRSEVAGSGIGSLTHQMDIRAVTASILRMGDVSPATAGSGANARRAKSARPTGSPSRRLGSSTCYRGALGKLSKLAKNL